MDPELWGQLTIPDDGHIVRCIGDAVIRARTLDDEWEIARSYLDSHSDEDASDGSAEAQIAWTRFVTVRNDTLTLKPGLPDRPVVVRPESPIVILPGRWGRFFVSIPLWIRFVSGAAGKDTVMEEVPSTVLPSTWFGDIGTGELCYALDVPLRRDVDPVADPGVATCEVRVTNGSKERLRFERICVHAEHMRLYLADGRLWTNEVRVVFRGTDQVSQLTFRNGPPERHPSGVVVCEPRVAPESSLIKRSFTLFREITGF